MRAALLPLLLFGIAMAQDSTPIPQPDKEHVFSVCRSDDNDVHDCVTGLRPTYMPNPDYPEKERKARHQGTVVLWVVVSPEGLPRDIIVLRTLSPEFDQAAIGAVRKWKFSRPTKDGKFVAAKTDVQVSFYLH